MDWVFCLFFAVVVVFCCWFFLGGGGGLGGDGVRIYDKIEWVLQQICVARKMCDVCAQVYVSEEYNVLF